MICNLVNILIAWSLKHTSVPMPSYVVLSHVISPFYCVRIWFMSGLFYNIIQPSGHLTIHMILMQLNVYNGGLQSAYLVLAIIPIMNALVSLIFLLLSNVVCVLT